MSVNRKAFWLGFASGLALGGLAARRMRPEPQAEHPFLGPRRLPRKPPLLIAHRGGEGLWPSGTLYAFEKALALGADVLEMDVHLTADGAIVVRHDDTVDSTTEGSGAIRDFTLEELKRLDAGYTWTADGGQTFPYRGKGLQIPTFEEVLLAFPKAKLNVDLKPAGHTLIAPFCNLLHRHAAVERVLVASFHDPVLDHFRQECPEAATAASPRETRRFWALTQAGLDAAYSPRVQAFQPPEWAGDLHVVTPRFIRAAHRHNIEVHVWTVNDPNDMRRLMRWGVDGIMTDYPDRLKQVIAKG